FGVLRSRAIAGMDALSRSLLRGVQQIQPSRLSSLRRSDHARLPCVTRPSTSPTDNRLGRSIHRKDDAAPRYPPRGCGSPAEMAVLFAVQRFAIAMELVVTAFIAPR